ncbi:MAG TPA: hypothetical protein VD973_27065 [Symbiobacteriaceae bacterium]|nr:hypothetical protein [Symbiobacteriaceae bacterium]
MPVKLPAVECSTTELAFLASLLGADSVIGVPDPFAGRGPDEIATAWDVARASLIERRLLSVQADSSICIEQTVAELVGTCGFAEATFLLTYTAGDGGVSGHHFHVIRRSAVELVLCHEEAITCRLSGLETGAVVGRVADIFRLGDQGAPAVPSGRLAERHLNRARQVAEETGAWAAELYLVSAGLCRETAAGLAVALARPLGTGALVAFAGARQEVGVDGLGLLEGVNGLWLLRNFTRENTRWVDLIPCSGQAMLAFIRTIMNRALPGNLL